MTKRKSSELFFNPLILMLSSLIGFIILGPIVHAFPILEGWFSTWKACYLFSFIGTFITFIFISFINLIRKISIDEDSDKSIITLLLLNLLLLK